MRNKVGEKVRNGLVRFISQLKGVVGSMPQRTQAPNHGTICYFEAEKQ